MQTTPPIPARYKASMRGGLPGEADLVTPIEYMGFGSPCAREFKSLTLPAWNQRYTRHTLPVRLARQGIREPPAGSKRRAGPPDNAHPGVLAFATITSNHGTKAWDCRASGVPPPGHNNAPAAGGQSPGHRRNPMGNRDVQWPAGVESDHGGGRKCSATSHNYRKETSGPLRNQG